MQQILQIPQLQPRFIGRLVGPSDPDYDQLRTVFMGGIDRKPSLIILAQNTTDVQQAIALSQETKLELAIRSGGHSSAAHSVSDGGIVLDLRQMKAIELDKSSQTVWVEPGLTAAELTNALDKDDFVLGFGDTGSVGIGGITLCGGIGFLVRKFGMAIDNLLAAEIVTADGRVLNVNTDHHPDLFWAIRGGGGNFGVVTRFQFKLHRLTEVVGGLLVLPAQPELVASFMTLAAQAPDELSTILNIMPAPPMPFLPAEHHGQLVMMAMMLFAGPAKAAEPVLAPFRALAAPLADMVKPIRYREMFWPDDDSYHPTAAAQTMFMDQVDLPIATTIIDQLKSSDASMRVVQLRALGGALAQVSNDATAFAHRHSHILVNVAAFYQGPEDRGRREAWVKKVAADLQQSDHGAYVAFLGADEVNRIKDAYPATTWERLAQVKRQYDPDNFFRLNQNIEPN